MARNTHRESPDSWRVFKMKYIHDLRVFFYRARSHLLFVVLFFALRQAGACLVYFTILSVIRAVVALASHLAGG